MCGIIGALNHSEALKIVKSGIGKIIERGRDGSGYFDGVDLVHSPTKEWNQEEINSASSESDSKPLQSIIAHNLHAIVNNVPQPIQIKKEKIAFATNCEIYNWKELCEKHDIKAENHSVLLMKLIAKDGIKKALNQLRGVYAFSYWDYKENKLYLARDLIGIKPLWYFQGEDGELVYSSEKKAIERYNHKINELNPREIIEYDIERKKIKFINRKFFKTEDDLSEEDLSKLGNEEYVLRELAKRIKEAVSIRIPSRKFGLLFSGGIDSVIIAKQLNDMGYDFTCYTAAVSEDSQDLVWAKKVAEELGLDLKYKIIDENQSDLVEKYLKKVVPLIEDNNVIKVGVALPLFVASELAKKDGNRVIFSGSGADEVFAGYNRYKENPHPELLNKDCYSDVLKIYEKNTYRDDVITMNNNLELRVPFLDLKLVQFGLNINPSLKISRRLDSEKLIEKYILREFAELIGISKTVANRPKKAAQYGSGFDKVIGKLAKKNKFKSKSEYLETFYKQKNLKLASLISSGKDGLYATYIMKNQNYDISCFINIISQNQSSYMFHTPNVNLAELQAKAAEVPIIIQKTTGEKEKELDDLKLAIKKAKDKYDIDGVVTGAIFSNYQRSRVEKICDELGLKIFSPLWHMDQELLMRNLLKHNFKFMFSSIAAYGLNKSWVGKVITETDINKLVKLNQKIGLNIAGEGGEFESLVLDCPLFKKELELIESEVIVENEETVNLKVSKAEIK